MAWQIDRSHSHIQFSARHMMISTVRGRFEEFTGTVHFDEQTPVNSSVAVDIKADSIDTRDGNRDGHLKSPDFLDSARYPLLTFKSTRIEKIDNNHGRIYGDLTICDITREVVLNAEYVGQARSPWGTVSAGFSASTSIDRRDWNLTWNQALETGGILVGDIIKIEIELELVRQQEAVQPEAKAIAAD